MSFLSPLNCLIINFKHQKWIPGKILILLDPHNLSVPQKLLFLDLPKMAIGKANGKCGNALFRHFLTYRQVMGV